MSEGAVIEDAIMDLLMGWQDEFTLYDSTTYPRKLAERAGEVARVAGVNPSPALLHRLQERLDRYSMHSASYGDNPSQFRLRARALLGIVEMELRQRVAAE